MNATARRRLAQSHFVRKPVDINVAGLCVYAASSIKAGFEAFEPEEAMQNGGFDRLVPGNPGRFSALEDRSQRMTSANLLGDTVQSDGRLVRVCPLTDPIARGRDSISS